jgi:RNA-directed DNA polymerase
MKSITRFITHKLKLNVNEAKSAVARPQERKFLGFSFTAGPEVKRVLAPKALDRFKRRIREITRQAKGVSIKTTIAEELPICEAGEATSASAKPLRCWSISLGGSGCDCESLSGGNGKLFRRRRAALLALGVRPRLARNTAGSGRGPWYLARSKALSVGLSNAYFRSLGLPSLVEGC